MTALQTKELKHGAYYAGECRNATEARWDANLKLFLYWRTKFGHRYLETIPNSDEPDYKYDVFYAEKELGDRYALSIPLKGIDP